MEIELWIGFGIIIFIILKQFSSLNSRIDDLQNKLFFLTSEIKKLTTTAIQPKVAEPLKPEVVVVKPEILEEEPSPVNFFEIPIQIVSEPEIKSEIEAVASVIDLPHEVVEIKEAKIEAQAEKITPKPVTKPTFFERNPDLEKFIGENLINKIGIAILVLGIGFFVKFAIDQNWITEIGRVAIGLASGGILIGIAHYLRKSFTAFSSVLVGGGIAVFYFTIALAFREYGIFSQTTAFVIMVFITLFAVLISILYNRQELAVLAILGGFIAPFLLTTGSGNYIVLFTYVCILISGMLVLAYFKKWLIVNGVSYVFTIVIYTTWLSTKVLGVVKAPYLGALSFATIFYFIFFLMNIANNIKENKKFIAFDISILLSNTFLYFSAGLWTLHYINGGIYQGLFTGLIAIFNLTFTYILFKNTKVDTNLLYLLIGIVLTFISLAAPIQLEGNYITLFWAVEAVLLLWLYQKTSIEIFKYSSIIVNLLMLISLSIDWHHTYSLNTTMVVLFNKGFVTGAVAVGTLMLSILLLKKEVKPLMPDISISFYANILKVIAVVSLYFVFCFELYYQLNTRIGIYEITQLYTGIYNYSFLLFLLLALVRFLPQYRIGYLPLLIVVLYVSYLSHYQYIIKEIRNEYLLNNSYSILIYLSHYLLIILLLISVSSIFRNLAKLYDKKSKVFNFSLWVFCYLLIYVASVELENILVMLNYNSVNNIESIIHTTYKIGFPILWGLCALIIMVIGMRSKIKMLRIIALSLFAITLLKLFIFDIGEMSEGGKIGAFISLGIILLLISFLYQKLKQLIIEDDSTKKD